ncbi:MAG: hypothetical protein AB1714_02885 [Acidobacteriota bacterium]
MNLRVLPVLLLASASPATAESPPTTLTRAPALRDCQATEIRDWGVWDDVFVCEDEEIVVLRRGEELFSVLLTVSSSPGRLATAQAARKAQIVAAAGSGTRLWLFMQSSDAAPFAIDAYSGTLSRFDIPGLKIPGDSAPGIQSHVIIRHADAALVMVAGGDRGTWPRDGNRPVYFWMNLKSGEVVALPIGWDLEYFSPDQKVAVFEKPQERDFVRRPLQAVDLRTGELTPETPDRRNTGAVPFDWTDTQTIKPLYQQRTETGDRDHFAGVVIDGSVYRFDLGLDGAHYLSTAKATNGFLGFRLRGEGATGGEPGALWLMELSQGKAPQLMATGVTDFAVLDAGNCVLATAGHGHRGLSTEAFFLAQGDKTMWNVLDGVDRMPELDKELAVKDYVDDKMSVRLIKDFGGGEHGGLVLCLFTHVRGDMRSLIAPVQGKPLERETWRRAVILSSEGHRYMIDILRDATLSDQIWFHNSGRVIMADYLWNSSGPSTERKVQLTEAWLPLHPGRDQRQAP